jgi:hypothetical protein
VIDPAPAARLQHQKGAMDIKVKWGTNVGTVPDNFKKSVETAVGLLNKLFTNNVTINLTASFDKTVTGAESGFTFLLDSTGKAVKTFTYSDVRTALQGISNKSAIQTTAYGSGSLPTADPTSSANIYITQADAQALGLGKTTAINGTAKFGSGSFDVGTVAHEITEIMGRSAEVDANGSGGLSPMDLFRYSASGSRVLDNVSGGTAYFSIDGGKTNLGNWNTVPKSGGVGGDLGDWATSGNPAPNDAFTYTDDNSGINPSPITLTDVQLMNVLGWSVSSTNTVTSGILDYVSSGVTHSGITVLTGGTQQVGSGGITRTLC